MISFPRRAGSRLLGLGAAQPDPTRTAAELGAPFDKPGAWVQARTGIAELRRAGSAEEIAALARAAARQALAAARLAEQDVDLVITASCSAGTGPWDVGSLAADIAPRAGRMQLNSACSGFSYALATADGLIRTGVAERVLIVAAEWMSGLVDPADLGTSIIFGDGAGAAVVGPAEGGRTGVGPVVWGSDGSAGGLIDCGPQVGGRMRMAGRAVFRWAVEQMPGIAAEACARAGVNLADVDVFVPHQANLRIIDAIAARLGLTRAVVAGHVTSAGNTSAASIPLALTQLLAEGRARSGQLALLLGFGAGLAWAGQVVEVP
ncbi:3-oxoacyl-[acyl-carrier-protein] synthase III [Jatrophihabitans endophyticus]|uniref:3-oxoacyl-[acyl-carrier-protein] synthase III n=1 Tax=Jatrophihabitans endophyticus TaxID=1206085 RepID=A0A1M5Q5E3_9ACTN|nr:beta-ketoacyl-ACP synthase 3 [Jatrophihabitans endophyticus]SHH09031.1 3-oxoacyl-[acyl-carrier-protein] synthase III [Jatrophihabitans endophyticus]